MRWTLLLVALSHGVVAADPAACHDKLVTGVVRRVDKDRVVVAIGEDEAVLHARDQLPKDKLEVGVTVVAYCARRGGTSTLSRTHERLVVLLFAREVKEIADGIVKVHDVARSPGVRTKISFSSTDANVDPIEAAVGPQGSRARAVVRALGGEKIDMAPYDAKPTRYVSNAMAPAQVTRIVVDDAAHRMELVVPDVDVAAAVGTAGENLSLAARLTGWKLDLLSETRYAEAVTTAKRRLTAVVKRARLPSALVDKIYQRGWRVPEDLVDATTSELVTELGIDQAAATRLVAAARAATPR